MTSIDGNWANYVQLLVGWKVERFQDPRFYMLLIKHEKEFVWDVDKLAEQHNHSRERLNVHNHSVESTWLMEDDCVLRLKLKNSSIRNIKCEIKITISEGRRNAFTSPPVWAEPKG
jgi:hypothetical protein